MSLLRVEGLAKSFDGFRANDGVDLEMAEGERHAVIGPNGAGKTTFFNLLTGRLKPDAGRALYRGDTITGLPPHEIVRRGISRSFQRVNVYPRLTVLENVQAALIPHHGMQFRLFQPADGLFRDDAMALLRSVGLEEDAARTAGTLAYGRQKQLELAVSLAPAPDLLLLDEPTAGMSPTETRATIDLIGRIAESRGLSLLFTEHDMDVVFAVADRVTVLHLGRVVAVGSPDEVREHDEVRRIYLGGAGHGPA